MARGRPTNYTTDIADLICAQIVEGASVAAIGRMPGLPAPATIFSWLKPREML